jgi:hypothetical protein
MGKRVIRFFAFVFLNLLAACAPAAFWVSGLPGSASTEWKLLFSPVALLLLDFWVLDPAVACCILAAFLLLVGLVSALLHRPRKAWVVVPSVVFLASLVQGLWTAAIVGGIDAIGHT